MKFDMKSMMEQVQKMQEEMDKMKTELAQKTVTAESGGGLVKVTMNGANNVTEISINKDIIDPNDPEMLEDLIVAAVNNASRNVNEMTQSEMSKFGGMLPNIPGLNLPF